MIIALVVIVLPLGLLMLIKPNAWYDFQEMFRSSTPGEPSNFFLASTRVSGAVLALAAIFGIVSSIMSGSQPSVAPGAVPDIKDVEIVFETNKNIIIKSIFG